jgi:NACHT domain
MATGVEASIARVGAQLLPLIGKPLLAKAARQRALEAAQATLVGNDSTRLLEVLNSKQVERLLELIDSPEYAALMLQALVYTAKLPSEDDVSTLREQIRVLLRHIRAFSGPESVEVTDAILELTLQAAHSVRASSSRDSSANRYSLRMDTAIAAAGARNSELIEGLRSLAAINSLAQRIRQRTSDLYKRMRLPTAVALQEAKWEELYVSPMLRVASESTRGGLTVEQALGTELRFIILGDPGAGKSTLTEKLALDLATDRYSTLRGQVPVVLRVRKYLEHIQQRERSLFELLLLALKVEYGIAASEEALEYLLLNGRLSVIVDGIDELGEAHLRADLSRMIDALAYEYPVARIVGTSRENAYDEAPLDVDLFQRAVVLPFATEEVRAYARSWFALADKDSGLLDRFMEQTQSTPDLRSNPLLLSLLCVLFSRDRELPKNRPEVYAACATLLLEKWDESRGIDLAPGLRIFTRKVVEAVAWLIFEEPARDLSVSREKLLAFLAKDVLGDKYVTHEEAWDAAASFLKFCAGRAWVLTETSTGTTESRYGFVHKTFLEYFAARYLVARSDSVDDLWTQLSSNFDASAWTVAGPLAVQIFDESRTDGADRLLQRVLDVLEEGEARLGAAANRRRAAIAFCCEILQATAPSNRTIERIVDLCMADALLPSWQRRHGAHAGNRAVQMYDSGLLALLRVQLSENVQRIANYIVDCLLDNRGQFPRVTDRAFLYNALLRRDDAKEKPVVGHVQTLLQSTELPERFTDLQDFLEGPRAEHIATFGVSALYCDLMIADCKITGPVYRVLDATGPYSTKRANAIAMLERIADPVEAEANVLASDWSAEYLDLGVEFLSIEHRDVDALPPRVRGILLLLLLPFVSRRGARDMKTASDAQMRSLWLARWDPTVESEAIRIVNDWSLTLKAHVAMTDWLISHKRRPPQRLKPFES